jgi:hypothetical protein
MTKHDLLAAARGKPVPFEFAGFACFLLPVPWGEMKQFQLRHKEGDAETAEAVTFELIAAAVCDEGGNRLLEAADCPKLPLSTINALTNEIARRSGVAKGNAESPTTTS